MPGTNFRQILDLLPDAVLVGDGSRRIIYANAAAARLLGWAVEDLLGRPLPEIVPAAAPGTPGAGIGLAGARPEDEPRDGRGIGPALRGDGRRVRVEWELRRGDRVGEGDGDLIVATLRPAAVTGPDLTPAPTSLVRRLRAMVESAARSGARQDCQAWLASVVETLVGDYGAAVARLWLCAGPDRDELSAVATARTPGTEGPPGGTPGPTGLTWSHAKLDHLLRRRTPWLSNDPAGDPDFDPGWVARERIASVAAFPLQRDGELLGLLELYNREPLTEAFTAALSAYAAIVAASLSDLQLWQQARTARFEAERQHAKLGTILDVLPVGVVVLEGSEGRISLINAAATEIMQLGAMAEEIDSLAALDARIPLLYPDGHTCPMQERPFWRTLHGGETVRETLMYRRPDGREVLFEIATAPFPGPEGGAVSVYNDVTESHQLRSELAERAGQLKALLDHLPVGVVYFDDRGICRAANGPARKLMGWARATMNGSTADELLSGAPALREALARCLRDRLPHLESTAPWPDPTGSSGIRYLDWRFEPLPIVPGRSAGVLALIVDMTERKLAADGLRRAAEAAERASHYKTRFLTAVSHDLRTPVNALSLQAEWLAIIAERQHDPDPDLIPLAADMRKATTNLIDLVNDLLELTLFDSGAVTYQVTDFALEPWLDTTLAPLRLQARGKGLTLSWRVDRPGRAVRADRVKLARVLVNLVGNAVKFTESGSVEVLAGAHPGGGLALTVRDTGPGIPPDQLDRIFDEFAQLRNPERDRTKGTGLGLAICKRLIAGAGGRLLVESRLGVGSTFTALYPPDHLIEAIEPPAPSPSPPLDGAVAVSPPAGTILVVEDDPYSRKSLVKLLERAGYDVEAVDDGLLALEVIGRRLPSLVLLDLMLPGMDGSKVLRRIREVADRDTLPVVVLSGDVLSSRSTELRALDINGVLAKPVDLEELRQVIRACVKPAPPE